MNFEEFVSSVRASGSTPIWVSGRNSRIPVPEEIVVVQAPSGVRSFVPEEMTVSCGAGTGVDDLLAAVAERGQYVNLPDRNGGSGTVGGALAVGEGDIFRLGRGSVRDALLQADFVDGRGNVIRAGGPTVKNVSGFDVCRLLVGSCGRLGFLGEVILRTRPLPLAQQWFMVHDCDWECVTTVMREMYKPSSVLWNGLTLHVCLEGHPDDLSEEIRHLSHRLERHVVESERPDLAGFPYRTLNRPQDIPKIVDQSGGRCVAEVGTGVVHQTTLSGPMESATNALQIEKRLLEAFDPQDRLNGGTAVWGPSHRRQVLVQR